VIFFYIFFLDSIHSTLITRALVSLDPFERINET
jgi:hypothetical protein